MIKKILIIMLLSFGMLSASFAFFMESYSFNNNGCLEKDVFNFFEPQESTFMVQDNQWLSHREPCKEDINSIENENLLKNTLMPTSKYTVCEKVPGTEEIVCNAKGLVEYEKSTNDVVVYNFKSKLRDPVTPCCGN